MLQHDIVLDDRHRLRRAEIEIDVAETANVETREDAPGGRLRIQTRHTPGERDDVLAARLELAQRIAAHSGERHRHALQVLLAPLGRDDDLVQPAVGCRGDAGTLFGLRRIHGGIGRLGGGDGGQCQHCGGRQKQRAARGGGSHVRSPFDELLPARHVPLTGPATRSFSKRDTLPRPRANPRLRPVCDGMCLDSPLRLPCYVEATDLLRAHAC